MECLKRERDGAIHGAEPNCAGLNAGKTLKILEAEDTPMYIFLKPNILFVAETV